MELKQYRERPPRVRAFQFTDVTEIDSVIETLLPEHHYNGDSPSWEVKSNTFYYGGRFTLTITTSTGVWEVRQYSYIVQDLDARGVVVGQAYVMSPLDFNTKWELDESA